jgi:tRNA threonylcarbamoyladenosine biosynthesis protein TsaB
MIVLGIDTSDYANAVGVVDGQRPLADRVFPARTDSLEQIVDNIDSVLKEAGLSFRDVGGIGVGLGPGSWTGIRVGVTVGKMLAFSSGKPVAGVPTFAALAYRVRSKNKLILSIIGVGTGDLVYAAFYQPENETVYRAGDYFVGSISELARMIAESAVIVSSQANSYVSLLKGKTSAEFEILPVETVPTGTAVGCLASERLERDEKDDTLSLAPLYLKESTARAFTGRRTGSGREDR